MHAFRMILFSYFRCWDDVKCQVKAAGAIVYKVALYYNQVFAPPPRPVPVSFLHRYKQSTQEKKPQKSDTKRSRL